MSKTNFTSSPDSKIDTAYIQSYDTNGNIQPAIVRTILYKNRWGKDSLYKWQTLENNIWALFQSYEEFFYDNTGRFTGKRVGFFPFAAPNVPRTYVRTRAVSYRYSGNVITEVADSNVSGGFSSASPSFPEIDAIWKYQYQYDGLGQLSEQTTSTLSRRGFLDTLFTPSTRVRYISYNAQKKTIEIRTDKWSANSWVETDLDSITYSNNNLSAFHVTYTKTGASWWLSGKYYERYCRLINAVSEPAIKDSSLKIYPNPAQNNVTLESKDNSMSKHNLQVFDYAGYLVLQQKELILPYTVDLSKLSDGLYFFKVNNEKGFLKTYKVLIMK